MFLLFPSLISLQGFAPFFLRLTLGGIFIFWGYRILKKKQKDVRVNIVGSFEVLVGLSLVLGYLTQLGALIALVMLGERIVHKIRAKQFLTDGANYYLILFVIAIAILISGPGFMAFDLPL